MAAHPQLEFLADQNPWSVLDLADIDLAIDKISHLEATGRRAG
jgi:hypothetical protein